MRPTVLADTGPIYASLDPSDLHHARALGDVERLGRTRCRILVTFPILLESYSLVRRRFDPSTALRWLTEMTESSLVNPAPEDYRVAQAQVRAYPDQRITLFDATLAVLALRMNLQVWTYDHHFDVMRVPVWRA